MEKRTEILEKRILSSADFVLEKMNSDEYKLLPEYKQKEALLNWLSATIINHPEEAVNPKHILYIWEKIKDANKDITETESLKTAITIYENLKELPEEKDKKGLDLAITRHKAEETSKKILEEAKNKFGKKVSADLLKKIMISKFELKKTEAESILNYLRDLRNSILPLKIGDLNEEELLISAFEKHLNYGEYKSNPVATTSTKLHDNFLLALTGFERNR